jgi:RNA polymerase sigma factor (sigma-70 family)
MPGPETGPNPSSVIGPTGGQGAAVRTGDESESELVARAQRDRGAFGPLYARYAERVYRYCYRRLESREAAEDATSLVFTRALAALPDYRGGSFAAWLFAIAHNVVVNAARRRPDLPLETAGDLVDAASGGSPEALALIAEDERTLQALLAGLPPDQVASSSCALPA